MFTQFELPVSHLGPEGHYVPPPARDPVEIDRRHGAHPGRLIAEQQFIGAQIAAEALRLVEEPEDVLFTAHTIAVSGLNSAWYSFAEGADMEVMRRTLRLPQLYGPTPEMRPKTRDVLNWAVQDLDYAVHNARAVEVAVHYGSPRAGDFRTQFGRIVGDASLKLATADLGDKIAGSPRIRDSHVQRMVRARNTRTLSDARSMVEAVGSHPSLAALAEPLSDLRVYIARNAPNGALRAIEEAEKTVLAA